MATSGRKGVTHILLMAPQPINPLCQCGNRCRNKATRPHTQRVLLFSTHSQRDSRTSWNGGLGQAPVERSGCMAMYSPISPKALIPAPEDPGVRMTSPTYHSQSPFLLPQSFQLPPGTSRAPLPGITLSTLQILTALLNSGAGIFSSRPHSGSFFL